MNDTQLQKLTVIDCCSVDCQMLKILVDEYNVRYEKTFELILPDKMSQFQNDRWYETMY
jgi:hypothetical protein